MKYIILCLLILILAVSSCNDPCYQPQYDTNCPNDPLRPDLDAYTFHMTVHPHLDAYWIFTFDDYYNPSPNNHGVRGYFSSNNFNSVKQIFNAALNALNNSRNWRDINGEVHEKAHRSFMNSEMGFFKHWYTNDINDQQRTTLKQILKTRFWEILGGGFVEHDQAGAYYDDIIDNFQIGLHWLKKEFGYMPKVAISADSFGHSQSNAAILSHIGIEGSLVERSDEHILTKNKTQFLWKAKSANNITYGVIPTVIRWAIHGYQNQFLRSGGGGSMCQQKLPYIQNLKRQNVFLKRLFNSSHILRYFGHDFQMFDQYAYEVLEGMMKKFSKQKCNKVIATYSNPTEYFERVFQQVYGKGVKQIQFREEDIMPIWDYDSGLYWTGYYTTDPYHKKIYKDAGRFAQLSRKLFTSMYLQDPKSQLNILAYDALERLEETVAYLQHHDGVTGTSKYTVMDHYQRLALGLEKQVKQKLINHAFQVNYPLNTNNQIFNCYLDQECILPDNTTSHLVYLKIFNSGGHRKQALKIHLPYGVYYEAIDCPFETICMCQDLPCSCTLYLYPDLYTFNSFTLKKIDKPSKAYLLEPFSSSNFLTISESSVAVNINSKTYQVSYKKVVAQPTPRRYDHLNRQGNFNPRSFYIRSGKYALGNNPNKIQVLSKIKQATIVETKNMTILVINWARQDMKTILTFQNSDKSSFKVDTISSAQIPHLADYYLSIKTPLKNNKQFYTDSNGWLVVKRTLFHHEDYEAHFDSNKYDDIDGNSYPINAFVYIQDGNDKVSVNVDRPEGVIVYQQGDIWLNFDRITEDDGKWVYETTYRSEYMKYTHVVSIQKVNQYKERLIQKSRDQGLYIQGNALDANERVEDIRPIMNIRDQWAKLSNIDNIKFNLKPWNDSTLLLRVHNLHDEKQQNLTLFANGPSGSGIVSVFLTSYFGRELVGDKIQQMSLGGNLNYEDFIRNKWNLHKFTPLQKQYSIFTKTFGQNITLRPLQIRTFLITNPKFGDTCQNVSMLKYSGVKKEYSLDLSKSFHKVPKNVLQQKVKNYLLNENHCDQNPNQQDIVRKLPPNYDYIQSPNQISFFYNNSRTETSQPETPKKPQTKPIDNKTFPVPPVKPKPESEIEKKPKQNEIEKVKQEGPSSLQLQTIKSLVKNNKFLTKQQKKIYFAWRILNTSKTPNCE